MRGQRRHGKSTSSIGAAARRFVRRACPDRISSHKHSPVSPDQRSVLRKTDGTLLYSVIDMTENGEPSFRRTCCTLPVSV